MNTTKAARIVTAASAVEVMQMKIKIEVPCELSDGQRITVRLEGEISGLDGDGAINVVKIYEPRITPVETEAAK